MKLITKHRKRVKPKECLSRISWVYHTWNFVNAQKRREIGFRLFGFEFVWEYEIPMGELRF